MFSSALNGEASTDETNEDVVMPSGVINDDSQREKAPFATGSTEENSFEEMTMAEIMCGKGDYFPGLIPLVNAYLDHIGCDHVTRERLKQYLTLIERRAKGELVTPATWIRDFVRTHPAYKGDSVVSDTIA